MLESKAFPIKKIYVPTKRRQTLDVEKVRQIAESMLQKGQDTPIMVPEDGERLVLRRERAVEPDTIPLIEDHQPLRNHAVSSVTLTGSRR